MEDFDSAVAAGWRRFTVDLGDLLATIDPGDSHVIRMDFLCADGLAREQLPFVVITTHGTTRIRATVCNATTSEDALLAEGRWRPRGTHPRTMEVGRRRADHLAHAVVGVLRDVFAVPDASFVDGTPPATPSAATGGTPDSRDALQRMVDATIAEISGRPVTKDEDGDIPMPTAVPSWLRVREDEAAIEVFCTRICSGDTVTAEMLFVVADRWPGITLTAREGALVARMRIEAAEFSPANLRSELARWFAFLDEGAQEIRDVLAEIAAEASDADGNDSTTGPRSTIIRTSDVTTTTGRSVSLPAPLEALLLVATTRPAALRPDEVATVMERDRDVILRCHRVCIGQRDEWETAADAAADGDDVEEAHACLVESWKWEDVARSLREALRVVLLERRRPTQRQSETHRPSEGHRRDARAADQRPGERPRDQRPPREQRPPHLTDPRDRR